MHPDPAAARRFLARVAAAALLLLLPVAALNAIVDPYALFGRSDSALGRCAAGYRTPALDAVQLGLSRSNADVVLLGNSRMMVGHDTLDPALRALGPRVFNFSWDAASLKDTQSRLAAATASHAPRAIVLGVGIGNFLSHPDPAGIAASAPAWRIVVAGLLGWPATAASLAVRHDASCRTPLRKLDGDVGAPLPQRNGAPPDAAALTRRIEAGFARDYTGWKGRTGPTLDPRTFGDLRALLDHACGRGTRVLVFFQPTHVRLLEITWQSGIWPLSETVKRRAVQELERARARGCDAQLWDFAAYDELMGEAPQPPEAETYFRESSHYTPRLGRLLTRAMIGEDASLGARLTTGNVELHLAALRAQRERYVARHPELPIEMAQLMASVRGRRSGE